MKKLLLILVAVTLALILPAGVVAAKAEANRIEVNLVGTYVIGGESQTASAVLTGNLREKGTDVYLSPLKGTIKIGDDEYDISVKAQKQSDPLWPLFVGRNVQNITVNVKGSKVAFDGEGAVVLDTNDELYSGLSFSGTTVDEVPFSCSISGEYSIID